MSSNIIFMGTPDFSVPILEALHKSEHKILQVYTQPPKKKNRGQKIKPSQLHDFCLKNEIKVKHPENLEDESASNYIKSLNPDVVVRSRGVIEKCSMCIQKIQALKLEAKIKGEPIKDEDAQTVCASSCSTNAIVF